MSRIGIMGGTFNPIHKGHTGIARCAYEQSDIDEILFMPSGTPAYKDNSPIVSATDRCNMVKLAIKPFDYMSLSTIETDRPGNTYTADTLAQIYDSYKKIYFIIGADSLLYIHEWYPPEYICSHCHLILSVKVLICFIPSLVHIMQHTSTTLKIKKYVLPSSGIQQESLQ